MSDVYDGFISLMEGQQDPKIVDPFVIKETKYQRGVNVSVRGGLARTAPGWTKIVKLEGDRFQGMKTWSLHSGDRVVIMMSGSLYVFNVNSNSLKNLGLQRDETVPQAFMTQADRWLLLQDGSGKPGYFEESAYGDQFVVIDGDQKLVTGTICAYGHGRIFQVPVYVPGSTANGKMYFLAGDILKPDNPSNIFNLTENMYLNEGYAMSLPNEMGYINGMQFLRNAETGTGLGSLIVMAKHGMSAFAVNTPRADWKNTDIGQVLFLEHGTISPWSIGTINGNVFYRSLDGFRTVAHSSAQGTDVGLSNVPMSGEVQGIIDKDEPACVPFVSAAAADNRIYLTARGYMTAKGARFGSLLVADAAVTRSLAGVDGPIWNGEWKSHPLCGICSALQNELPTLYGVVEYGDELWLCSMAERAPEPTLSRIYTRAMVFSGLKQEKTLKTVELHVSDVTMDTEFAVYYRPYGFSLWALAGRRVMKVSGSRPGSGIIFFGISTKACDPTTSRRLTSGRAFEFCIEWEGNAKVHAFMVSASQDVPAEHVGCDFEAKDPTVPIDGSLIDLDAIDG